MTQLESFLRLPQCALVRQALEQDSRHLAIGGLWGASAALLVAALLHRQQRPWLVITADDGDTTTFADDLATFGAPGAIRLPEQIIDPDGELETLSLAERARALRTFEDRVRAGERATIVVTSLAALLVPAPPIGSGGGAGIVLAVRERHDPAELLARCLEHGMRRVDLVTAPGEVSRRGDVLDVYPLAADQAVRLEFFDEELESIRTLDPDSQRSLVQLERVALPIGSSGRPTPARPRHVLQHVMRSDLIVAWFEPLRIDERRQTLATLGGPDTRNALVALAETLRATSSLELGALPSRDLDFRILSTGGGAAAGEVDPLGRLRHLRGLAGGTVEIVCRTEGEETRLREVLAHKGIDPDRERLRIRIGALSRGFRVPDLEWTILSNLEFAGAPTARAIRARPKVPTRAVQSFFELGPGDLVVHAVHGIARFEGIERITRNGAEEDCLRLVFQDDLRLLVPVSKIHLVQKYVGAGGGHQPKLDKLGGKGFARRKAEIQQSLFDLAADLLEVEAERERSRREPYPYEPLEDAFLDDFPFEDTPDQAQCWKELRADLESDRPMDRLLCGDVGFGKTELALRATFRVAVQGRQVAVLVPTTLLAEQHSRTFSTRLAPHGLRTAMLSRFVSKKERDRILADCASGKIDVIIGTHRLLSDDLKFRSLGLVVVDEEQRFGVRQKEHMKRIRAGVDVLTLSATPIPRTLHSALLGIRRISTLSTPPPGRQDVETRLAWREDGILRDAIAHELARGGQVYVLHDRIAGLDALAKTIRRLVPEASVAVGHGELSERELDKTVRKFLAGEVDVLVSTSIVENGLDIPRANTMLIDRAEMFGLAELHQLRGRVGRSDKKAICWLLIDRLEPPPEASRRRLQALVDLSHLGAGFAIAMKDLEIRGAGSLLGPQQSGHIAAVGYEMYCHLLRSAVEQAREHGVVTVPEIREVDVDLGVSAFVPQDLVSDQKSRLELLREMDAAIDTVEAARVRAGLIDRFGKLPQPLEVLLRVFLLKHLLLDQDVLAVQRTGPDRVVVRHAADQPLGGAWLDHFADVRRVESGKTHLVLPLRRGRKVADWTPIETLQLLLESLSAGDALPRIASCERNSSRAGHSSRSR
ncbi:MAG: DEAD/DEAH box helicase [Planctomycetota bacterium]